MDSLIEGRQIKDDTLGVVYLCEYSPEESTLKATGMLEFKTSIGAVNAYAEIPNPESHIATGGDREQFESNIAILHKRMQSQEYIDQLKLVI